MKPRDGFGLHIEFAHDMLAFSSDLCPAGLGERQINFRLPEEIGDGSIEVTLLGAGVSYGTWVCNDAREHQDARRASVSVCFVPIPVAT